MRTFRHQLEVKTGICDAETDMAIHGTNKTKLRVFGSNVKAVLLYGSDWSRSCKCSSNRARETSCGFGGLEVRISNKELWRQTGQLPIEKEIRQRAWDWIGHKLRRPYEHVVKRALEWNSQEKRKKGRPQHTWRRTRMAELEG